MNSILVRYEGKDYYVNYDMLLNKATKKLFAFEDPELQKVAKLNGGTLIFDKSEMEDRLKHSLRMSSPMPGAAKTENNMLGLGSSPEQLEKTKISDKEKFDREIDKIIKSNMGTLVKDIPAEKIIYAIEFLKKKTAMGATKFLYNTNIKKLEKALKHKEESKIFKENKMTNEQKLRKYIREMIRESLKEDDPYGQPDEDKYLFKTDQDYLAGIQGDSLDEVVEEPNAEDLAAKQKAAEKRAKKAAYQRFFSQALAKFGYSAVASIPDEKKKAFWNFIDSNWTSKQETPVKTENQGHGYRMSPSDDYEVDLKLCDHKTGENIVDKLKYKPGVIDVSYSECIFHCEPGTDISKYLSPNEMKFIKRKVQNELKEKEIEPIDEESNTSGIAGYETPNAFTGKKGISKKQKSIANQLGYELVDKSYAVKDQGDTQDLNEGLLKEQQSYHDKIVNLLISYAERIINPSNTKRYIEDTWFSDIAKDIAGSDMMKEGLDSYYFKDENLTSEQKLGLAMRQVRNNLYEVEKVVQRTIKMKNEENVDSTKVGKRTYSALRRINEKVVRLMVALQDLK